MAWLFGLLGFAIGIIVGAAAYKQLMSDEAKVKTLEDQLRDLEREHEAYKDNVHSHFNNTATLLNNLTDSYREVYRHVASGAQALCPEYISEQLSHSARAQDSLTRDTFSNDPENSEPEEIIPPRDYADKTDPDRKGTLAEDYGLDKPAESPEEER